jgi:hypothetical protein
MRLLAKDPWAPPQTGLSALTGCLTKPDLPGSAEHKPPNDPFAAVASPGPRDLLTAEQEWVMAEHVPIVWFIAWRIHDRLPPHVPIEDLYSAGVLELLDAFGRFRSVQASSIPHVCRFRTPGSYSRQSAAARLESPRAKA